MPRTLVALALILLPLFTQGQPKVLLNKANKIVNAQPDSARILYDEILRKGAPDSLTIVRAYVGLAMCSQFSASFDSALYYYHVALKEAKRLHYDHEIGSILCNIGSLQMGIQKLDEASVNFTEALKVMELQQDTLWISRILINQAGVEYMSGNTEGSLNKLKDAAYLCKLSGNLQSEGGAYANMSIVYTNTQQYDSALKYVDKGINLLQEQNKMRDATIAMLEKAKLLANINMKEEGIKVCKEVIDLAEQQGFKNTLYKAHLWLSELYAGDYNHSKAYEHLNISMQWKDSVFNEQSSKTIEELSTKYETEKKDQAIASLAKENELKQQEQKMLWLIVVGVCLIAALITFFYWQKRKANSLLDHKNKTITASLKEREVLLKEIHHRVKNNLQIVSSLLNMQSRYLNNDQAKKAVLEGRDRVQSMALVHQKLYQNDDLAKIKLSEYLDSLSDTLMSTYNVESDKITLEKSIKPLSLDLDTTIYLGLMLNELITNALKHAFPDDRSGVVAIALEQKGEEVKLTVSDNGIGYSTGDEIDNSYGQRLIATLARGLNASVNVENNIGTKTSITFQIA